MRAENCSTSGPNHFINFNTNVLIPVHWSECVYVCVCGYIYISVILNVGLSVCMGKRSRPLSWLGHQAAVLAKIAADPSGLSLSDSVAIKTEPLAMTH